MPLGSGMTAPSAPPSAIRYSSRTGHPQPTLQDLADARRVPSLGRQGRAEDVGRSCRGKASTARDNPLEEVNPFRRGRGLPVPVALDLRNLVARIGRRTSADLTVGQDAGNRRHASTSAHDAASVEPYPKLLGMIGPPLAERQLSVDERSANDSARLERVALETADREQRRASVPESRTRRDSSNLMDRLSQPRLKHRHLYHLKNPGQSLVSALVSLKPGGCLALGTQSAHLEQVLAGLPAGQRRENGW
jgi:hypothetical protein